LGVFVRDGKIEFKPLLLRKGEFLPAPASFDFFDIHGNQRRLQLKPHSLAFSYCQTPFIYQLAANNSVEVWLSKNKCVRQDALYLDETISRSIFDRTGRVNKIIVSLKKAGLE